MTPGSLLVAWLRQLRGWLVGCSGGSQVCGGASDIAAGAAVHALRRPLGALHGVAGAAGRPRKRRSVQRGLRWRDGQVDRMVGVLGMAWRSGRCCHEGYAELKVTVYGHGGMRGGTGRCFLEGYAEL